MIRGAVDACPLSRQPDAVAPSVLTQDFLGEWKVETRTLTCHAIGAACPFQQLILVWKAVDGIIIDPITAVGTAVDETKRNGVKSAWKLGRDG